MRRYALGLILIAALTAAVPAFAQGPIAVSATTPATNIALVPISATTAINNATTLTIPAPPGGLSNYVCSLAFSMSQNATSTVQSNAGATSTNFNGFAFTVSLPATANLNSKVETMFSTSPISGCAKSAVPGTATTFVQTVAAAQMTWTWYATYFQAP